MARTLTFTPLAVACGVASPTPPNTPSSRLPSSEAWKELRISWDYSPCPIGGQSCHQTLEVSFEGGFVAAERNPDGSAEPVRRFSALESQEVRELHRVVTSGFVERLGSCGGAAARAATVRIEVDSASGETRKEEVAGCVSSTSPETAPPRALVEMLEHHRWSSHDAKPQHPKPPSGQGDPCTVSEGCGTGLICVASPCVVAPCESGSCQTTTP
jgi:hypothetical protein